MRTLPQVFSQRDPQWTADLMGTSTVTLGDDGCYVTSFAMLSCYYGKQTTPEVLNKYLTDNKLYVEGDCIGSDNTLQSVYPDILYQQSLNYPDPTPADLNELKALMTDPTVSVILEIELAPGDTHFVVLYGL